MTQAPSLWRFKETKFLQDADTKRWRLSGTSLRTASAALQKRTAEKLVRPVIKPVKTRVERPLKRERRRVLREDVTLKIPKPWKWQDEAFSAWVTRGRCGYIEAVTGTGKTMLGIRAAAGNCSSEGR